MKPDGVPFHVKRDAERVGIPLTDEQAASIGLFHDLLLERSPSLGLISESDSARLYERHIRDSLGAAGVFRPGDSLAYDIGSGAGLPGIVLAVSLPGVRFRLVEPMRRRLAFLEYAIERLRLGNAEPVGRRVEELEGSADVATSRAFAAPLPSWEAARRLLRSGGRLVYFLGANTRVDAAALQESGEPPAMIAVEKVLDSGPNLAIMSRR